MQQLVLLEGIKSLSMETIARAGLSDGAALRESGQERAFLAAEGLLWCRGGCFTCAASGGFLTAAS